MNLFNAGVIFGMPTNGRTYNLLEERERELRHRNPWYLESYHYIKNLTAVERMRAEGVKVFLDSGAFSAYTQGVQIDLHEYCDYIHRNGDFIAMASVLDAIGDPDGTWQNQWRMEQLGVNPLPCYHYGEPTEVLDYYVQNYDYITIGGMVPISTPQLILWLDRIWEKHLTHADGTPKVKVHGFGLTSLPLMLRYPWYSIDSSTWVQWAANGMILLPRKKAYQIDISEKSPRRKVKDQHLDTLNPLAKENIYSWIKDRGVDPNRLRELYYARWAWNMWAFPEYVRVHNNGAEVFKTVDQELPLVENEFV